MAFRKGGGDGGRSFGRGGRRPSSGGGRFGERPGRFGGRDRDSRDSGLDSGERSFRKSGKFEGNRGFGGGRSGGFGGRNRGFGGSERRAPLEMHEVTCSKCGKKCEVPFKPTGGKPVYCSECFVKPESSGSRSSGISQEQIDKINAKLDKIMKALNVE